MAKTKIQREFYWKRHLIALIITLIIFSFGILIGSTLSDERIEFTKTDIERQQIEYQSLQMQLLYLTAQEEKNCNVLLNTLERNIYDLENSRVKLENYIQGAEDGDYYTIKRDYMLTEIRYWLMTKEAEKVCPSDTVSILYFYETDESCADCSAQGHILTYLKNMFGDKLLVFSLDVNFDEPMVQILKENYGVEVLPTLVVEDKVLSGLTKKEELIKELCFYYSKTSSELCQYE
jgi:hypothetical protein